jgi:hypothetical protein
MRRHILEVTGSNTLANRVLEAIEQNEFSNSTDISTHEEEVEFWNDVDVSAVRKQHPFFLGKKQVQLQDYGMNKGLPFLNYKRVSKDYYTSCLKWVYIYVHFLVNITLSIHAYYSLYNFVVVEASLAQNYVTFYEELLMGKDCNATSTLRFNMHFASYQVQ